jgi:hypothetical protein
MSSKRQQYLNQSFMRIPRRAENNDRGTLAATYVNAGSFSAMLHSTDHQVLYGRRGAGKTHALQHLSDLIDRTGDVAIYLDLRTIGSTGGTYAGGETSATRGTHLLVDVLETIHDELFHFAIEQEDNLLETLDTLAEAATAVEVVGEVERETTIAGTRETRLGLELSTSPSTKLTADDTVSTSAQSRLCRTGVERHHIVFGPLSRALRGISRALGSRRLWLLLDEWSSIPLDLQPLLADPGGRQSQLSMHSWSGRRASRA